MKKLFVILIAIAVAAVSCNREPVPDDTVNGKGAKITVELPGDDNTGFSFEGNKLKTYWELGDQLLVTYTKDGKEVREIFTYTATEKSPSGEFTCPESNLTEETVYNVQHPVKPDWNIQNGTLEDLPDYMVATDVQGSLSKASLQRKVIFLHVVESAGAGTGKYTQASLNKVFGGCTLYAAPGEKSPIIIKPKDGFDLAQGVDMFVTVMFDGATSAPGTAELVYAGESSAKPSLFRICFANAFQGISLDGQCYDPVAPYTKMDWTTNTDLKAGYWYNLANKTLESFEGGVTNPR